MFARCRSLQLLDIATDECPRWIFACCCLHNLLERTHEPFDRAWLEVEDVFPDVALEHGAAADGGEADAAEEVAVVEPAAARRDRDARDIWYRTHPDHRI